jgi:hypothetical protein
MTATLPLAAWPIYDHCPAWCQETEHPFGTDIDGNSTDTRRGDDDGAPHWHHVGGRDLPVSVSAGRPNLHGARRDGRVPSDYVEVSVDRSRLVIDDDPLMEPHLRVSASEARSLAALLVRAADVLELH